MPHHVVWEMHFDDMGVLRVVVDTLIQDDSVLGMERAEGDAIRLLVTLREGFVEPANFPDWDVWSESPNGFHIDYIGEGHRYRVAPLAAEAIYERMDGAIPGMIPLGVFAFSDHPPRTQSWTPERRPWAGFLTHPLNEDGQGIPLWLSVEEPLDPFRHGPARHEFSGTGVIVQRTMRTRNGDVLEVTGPWTGVLYTTAEYVVHQNDDSVEAPIIEIPEDENVEEVEAEPENEIPMRVTSAEDPFYMPSMTSFWRSLQEALDGLSAAIFTMHRQMRIVAHHPPYTLVRYAVGDGGVVVRTVDLPPEAPLVSVPLDLLDVVILRPLRAVTSEGRRMQIDAGARVAILSRGPDVSNLILAFGERVAVRDEEFLAAIAIPAAFSRLGDLNLEEN